MSIQTSLIRWFAFQTFLALSVVCASVYVATSMSLQARQQEQFDHHFAVTRHIMVEFGSSMDVSALRRKLDDYLVSHADASLTVRRGGALLYSSEPKAASGTWHFERYQLPGAGGSEAPIELSMSLDIGSDELLLRRMAFTLVLAAAVGSLLVSYTGAVLVRRGLAPLRRLAAETGAAGPNLPGHRIDPADYATELRPWIAQFNGLLVRAEAAYAQLEAFNADVAHELRTPLSNMIAQAEVELAVESSKEELYEVLSSLLEEARRLGGIVNDMLFLSKADRGALARRGKPESLSLQVRAVAEFQEAALEEAGIALVIEGDALLPMDVGLVRRAVSNLVGNSLRYAPAGSEVRVDIHQDRNEVRLSVENTGAGIEPADMPRLFERFYRVDQSRSGSSIHHGLGLAIVSAIARMHGGRTFAYSQDGLTKIGLSLSTLALSPARDVSTGGSVRSQRTR